MKKYFYKIYRNDVIVDLSKTFLKILEHNGLPLTTERENAQLLYGDINNFSYYTSWTKPISDKFKSIYLYGTTEEITEEEYNRLKKELIRKNDLEIVDQDLQEIVDEIRSEEESLGDNNFEENYENDELLNNIYKPSLTLSDAQLILKQLYEKNQQLEECIIELTKKLYN